jgi:hypothetical protein
MKINASNIEQWLFEYFEKQLSESECQELMNFIHKNPAFEKEFLAWQKSYHHETKLEDYNITAQIKNQTSQKSPFPRNMALGLGIGAISLVVVLWMSGIKNNPTQPIPAIANPKTKPNTINTVQHPENQMERERSFYTNTQNYKTNNNHIFNQLPTKDSMNSIIPFSIESEQNIKNIPSEFISSNKGEVQESNTTGFINSEQNQSKITEEVPKNESETSNDKKDKKGKAFRSTNKIEPINSNF